MALMQCGCGNEGSVVRGKQVFCTNCFFDFFEKHAKKALREHELRKDENVLVVGELSAYLVKRFVHVPLKLEFSSTIREGYDWVIIERTLDDSCLAFFTAFCTTLRFVREDKTVSVLHYLSDADAVDYARMKGLRFTPLAKEGAFWTYLELFHAQPEMRRNMLRNADELQQLLLK